MSLIVIFSIASCQKNCNHNGAYELASMTMEIDECTLKGSETTIRIHIKNDGETITHLDDFRLKANIAETGGIESMLAYGDADNNRKSKAEIDELLTHFFEHESLDPEDAVTTELQFQPGASVSHAVINLELYDTNKEETVAKKTVTWSQAVCVKFDDMSSEGDKTDKNLANNSLTKLGYFFLNWFRYSNTRKSRSATADADKSDTASKISELSKNNEYDIPELIHRGWTGSPSSVISRPATPRGDSESITDANSTTAPQSLPLNPFKRISPFKRNTVKPKPKPRWR